MNRNPTQLAYQEAAVRNANAVELVVILYDILARDLQQAMEAIEAGDIEMRSKKIKHGFLALQQLEGTLNMEEGGELATNMARFYSMLRAQMMKAQIEQDPQVLQELIQLLFSVRDAWVQVNDRSVPIQNASVPARRSPYEQSEAQTGSWKA